VFVRVWDYEVPADAVPAFRTAYSSHGDWAELFGRAAGYLGTELYHERDGGGRFLTIDRWRTEQDWLAFRETFLADYEALDARLDGLAAVERSWFEGSSEL
jgi:heme-degrading monooxygenase HmoA